MAKVLAFSRKPSQSGAHETIAMPGSRRVPATVIRLEPRGGPSTRIPVAGTPVISVVVPTKGHPELLRQCLSSLMTQHFDPRRYEIVVVDDEPHLATRAVVEECAAESRCDTPPGPDIHYIPSPGPHGPAAARNRGWRAARGSIIAFTDDNTRARPTWLQNGLNAFENGVEAVWGRIVMPLPPRIAPTLPTDYERNAKGLERAEFVTANCFCQRQVLNELGGFDERFHAARREDADLYFRLLERNSRIVHQLSAIVSHPVRPAQWGISLRQQKKVLFDALLYKKHPSLYREKIHALPRWDHYLVVAAMLTCLMSLASGRLNVAAFAGGLWLAMWARFCLQRLDCTSRAPSHVAEMMLTSALIPPLAVFWRIVGSVRFRVLFL